MALKDVIGHERSVSILLRTIKRDRVPSAYLFAGESGIGKKFAAVNLAKAINCLSNAQDANPESEIQNTGLEGLGLIFRDDSPDVSHNTFPDACDACASCKKIDAGTHPDLLFISPEKGEIRIDEVRAVENVLLFKPYEGRKKVVIMDDADTMNQPAANAFLKTLEEPPEDSLLILIAANPDRLPETIKSRCCRINFAPLSHRDCEKVITSRQHGAGSRVAGSKEEGADTATSAAMVRLAMGRPGFIVSSDLLKQMQRFAVLLQSMISSGKEIWTDREEMEQWLDAACIFLRDLAVLNITGDDSLMFDSGASRQMKDRGDATEKTKALSEAFGKIMSLKQQMGFNLNKAITWNYTASVMKTALCYQR